MATIYVTVEQVREYAGLNFPDLDLPEDDAELEALIIRAELDIDRMCQGWPLLSTGRRFDPPTLPVTSRDALVRATCEQVLFVGRVGVDELTTSHDLVTGVGGSLTFAALPPDRIGRRTLECLSGFGLITWSGCVEPYPDGVL